MGGRIGALLLGCAALLLGQPASLPVAFDGVLEEPVVLHAGQVQSPMLLRLLLKDCAKSPGASIAIHGVEIPLHALIAGSPDLYIPLWPGTPSEIALKPEPGSSERLSLVLEESASAVATLVLRESRRDPIAVRGAVAILSRDGLEVPWIYDATQKAFSSLFATLGEPRTVLLPAGPRLQLVGYSHPWRSESRRRMTPKPGSRLQLTFELGIDRRPEGARLMLPRAFALSDHWRKVFDIDDQPPEVAVIAAETMDNPHAAAAILIALPLGDAVVMPRGGALRAPFGPTDWGSMRGRDGQMIHSSGLALQLRGPARAIRAASVRKSPSEVLMEIAGQVDRKSRIQVFAARGELLTEEVQSEFVLRLEAIPGEPLVVYATEIESSRGLFARKAKAALELTVPSL